MKSWIRIQLFLLAFIIVPSSDSLLSLGEFGLTQSRAIDCQGALEVISGDTLDLEGKGYRVDINANGGHYTPRIFHIENFRNGTAIISVATTKNAQTPGRNLLLPKEVVFQVLVRELETKKRHLFEDSRYEVTEILLENSFYKAKVGDLISFQGSMWSGWDHGEVRLGKNQKFRYARSYANAPGYGY